MFVPRILKNKRFDLAELGIDHLQSEWSANAAYEAHVADAWEQRVREAQSGGFKIWDGTYYRVTNVEEFEEAQRPINLRLETISYRYIATYRHLHKEHALNGLLPLYHLATAALLRTRDGWYLFGRRAKDGSVDLIGGGAQRDELLVTHGRDLEANIVKEIREEVGIGRSDIGRIVGIGLLLSSTSNVLVIMHVELQLSRQAAEEAFAYREEDEMAEPVFVSSEQLIPFLRSMADCRALVPDLLSESHL
jgi:8-oxo-dGTP pyrophosphatase MutT (NUDIX family)